MVDNVVFYLSSYSYSAQEFLSPDSDILEMAIGYRDFFKNSIKFTFHSQ